MRANVNALNEIKERIANIKGDSINLSVNRGRKKIDKLKGFVENIYPSVFTFMTDKKARETFSYFDVLCGLVKFDNNVASENN
ncbi:MAG: Veg family protein [Eubacteriales bacterium]|nr:Veg family protein [Eubacteriales bacterium]